MSKANSQNRSRPQPSTAGPTPIAPAAPSLQDLYGNEFLRGLLAAPQPSTSGSAVAVRSDTTPADWEPPARPVEPGAPGTQVGLVVRGKASLGEVPEPTETHADVLLSNGMPVGFFGQAPRDPGPLQQVGMGLPGRVSDPEWLETFDADLDGVGDRAAYLDGDLAEAWGWADTVCTLDVTPEQAARFDEYWRALSKDPGTFSYVGGNCSTHAAEAFEAAGLIDGGIPGLDTPEALYELLAARYGDALRCESGYLDFDQGGDGQWTHSVRPASR